MSPSARGPADAMITPESVVSLAPKVRLREDHVGGATVLLAPERGLELNATAAAVLRALDGVRSVREIAALLAAQY
ncbi:MAG: pyrroloquinoline quinone biosynthesis peptide chaperone PqqD, partial [Acetobacteraceae bacterium]